MPSLRLRRSAAVLSLLTAGALALTGCSAGSAPDASGTGSADGAFPATIEHGYGKTVIESAPRSVATIGWCSFDAAIALGTIPVTIPKATFGDPDGDGYLEWTKAAIEADKA